MSEKPLDQTIKGGAYQNADGSWINAHGKPIPTPKVGAAQPPSAPAEPSPSAPPAVEESIVTDTDNAPAEVTPKRSRAKKS